MIIADLNNAPEYDLVYADPPWQQTKGGGKKVRSKSSGTPLDYPTLDLQQIAEHLRLATRGGCKVLFLWTIDKYLFEAQKIAESLGFKLHARMIWNKVNGIPTAFTVRYGHEYLLFMYKGKFTPIAFNERGKVHTVFTEKATKHSKKPEKAYEIIKRLYPNLSKIELYARQEHEGFDAWGNELAEGGAFK